jgi:aspartyl-tRNA(Asn)/glutamyl-tRNA(Gln) amidotransferase subunit A
MMANIADLTAHDLLRAYRDRKLSPVEVIADTLDRIEASEPAINGFMIVDRAGAMAQARASEARWRAGETLGLADGIGATVKDNLWLAGFPSRRGTLAASTDPVSADAPAVARLKEKGAVILGKTTMPEFGFAGVSHSPVHGQTHNPWKHGHTTGGSSSGAASSAALNLGHFHLGTDGAGSVRIPAAFTGIFAIKASHGRVPAWPQSPFWVLAHTGPMTRTVRDGALMLTLISGADDRDMSAWNTTPPDYRAGIEAGVKGLRIAYSPKLGMDAKVDPDVVAATERAARLFADMGAIVDAVDPPLAGARDMIDTIWNATCTAVLDGIPVEKHAGIDRDFIAMAQAGRAVSTTAYLTAYAARNEMAARMAAFHRSYDLLISPQMPTGAIQAGLICPKDGSYGSNWLNWSPFTYPFNLTQQPAASVPSGLTREGLPIGLQIVAALRREDLILRAALAFETASGFVPLSTPRR